MNKLPATQRFPSQADDLNAGYKAGDLWNADGKIYQNLAHTSGRSIWLPMPEAYALPCDAVPGATAAYGMRRLSRFYSKNQCLDVRRASDGMTTTIGFLGNDQLDEPLLDAFLGGETGQVIRWYDQSGNGNDLVQENVAAAPLVSPLCQIGNSRSLAFDSRLKNDGDPVPRVMRISATMAVKFNDHAVICLSRFRSNASNVAPLQLSNTDGSLKFTFGWGATANRFFVAQTGQVLGEANTGAANTPFICGYSTGEISYCFVEEQQFALKPAPFLISTGGVVGQQHIRGTAEGYFDAGAILIYSKALAVPAMQIARAALHRAFATHPQTRDVWIADGDSITEGAGCSLMQHYARQATPFLDRPMNVYVNGYYGMQVDYIGRKFHENSALRFCKGAQNNILTIFAGTNDANAGDPSQVYGRLVKYIADAKTVGFKVGVATMLPNAGGERVMNFQIQYNQLIRANAGKADTIIDIASDPIMGDLAAVRGTPFYVTGKHVTSLGHSILASYFAAAVNKLLKQD